MLKKVLDHIIYGYELKDSIPEINDRLVVAGDPACDVGGMFKSVCLPKNDAKKVSNLDEYEISGFSMYPCGISDTDHIFVCKGITSDKLKDNDFIMVKVDQSDYENEKIHYNHKLRRFLMNLSSKDSLDEIVVNLQGHHPEILLDSYRKRLEEKFEKSKKRYTDIDKFSLSFTFKDGVMTYSFHPSEYIEGRVDYVYSQKDNVLKDAKCFKPY